MCVCVYIYIYIIWLCPWNIEHFFLDIVIYIYIYLYIYISCRADAVEFLGSLSLSLSLSLSHYFIQNLLNANEFKPVLADSLSLVSKWQQVSFGLQDSSQYSGLFQQCFSLDVLDSFSNF